MFSAQKAILITLVLFLCLSPAVAQTVSFADPDATVHKDVLMYNSTGSLVGTYNTTTSGIELPESDVLFVFKPQYSNPLDEPGTFLESIIGFVQTNALALLILAAMGGLLFKRF